MTPSTRTRAILAATTAVAASVALAAPAFAAKPGDQTITEIAVADGRFTYLVAALQATGLDAVLDGDGQYTVFAPTDAAFEQVADELAVAGIGDGTVPTLLGFLVENELADDVLLYHVTDGRRGSQSLVGKNDKEVETLLGAFLTVTPAGTVQDASGATADATIVIPNISASNGVIHAIDNVLVPLG